MSAGTELSGLKWDGLTRLPSEAELRAAGFTDHVPELWYYTVRVGSSETLNITVAKAPFGTLDGKPVHTYRELVMDESFGQPAYFGRMREPFRSEIARMISSELSRFRGIGLQVEVDPSEYSWENWPEAKPLRGIEGELNSEGSVVTTPAAEKDLAIAIPLDPELIGAVAAAIDREVENHSWDSLANGMSLGEYVAPTAIRTYLRGLKSS